MAGEINGMKFCHFCGIDSVTFLLQKLVSLPQLNCAIQTCCLMRALSETKPSLKKTLEPEQPSKRIQF